MMAKTDMASMGADAGPVCLSIAGSDSSGGAGLQMDLAVFRALGCAAASVVTCVTAQSHTRMAGLEAVSVGLVRAQLEMVLGELPVAAIKLGALATAPIVRTVAAVLAGYPGIPCVIDPVMLSSSGRALLDGPGVEALVAELVPRAALVTPNIPEAQVLADMSDEVGVGVLAEALWERWQIPVLVKGGHADAGSPVIHDVLCDSGASVTYESPRQSLGSPRGVRGTGCALASAIAACLARRESLREAVPHARAHLQRWLAAPAMIGPHATLLPQ